MWTSASKETTCLSVVADPRPVGAVESREIVDEHRNNLIGPGAASESCSRAGSACSVPGRSVETA